MSHEEVDDLEVDEGEVEPVQNDSYGEFQRRLDKFLQGVRKAGQAQATGDDEVNQKPLPEAFIFAVMEPHTHKDQLTNCSGAITIFDSKAKNARAALVLSKSLNAWPVEEFTDRDQAVAQVKTNDGLSVYIVSLYADINYAPIRAKLKALINKASQENSQVIVMGDLNSHSESLWNDKRTCNRGKAWEAYVMDKGLTVLNTGDMFTFNTKKGQSIIDVTLSNADMAHRIGAWEVVDAVPGSDHVMIQFALQLDCVTKAARRNFRKCDWQRFTETLEIAQMNRSQKDTWDRDDLESETANLLNDIEAAVDEACPMSVQQEGMRKLDWWDSESKRLHIRLQSIRKYLRWHRKYCPDQRRAKYTEDDLIACRRGFKSACRRAKRKAWQSFIMDQESSPEVARLNRALVKKVNKDIGLLVNPETGKSCTPEESIALLCSTHFPKCRTDPPDRDRQQAQQTCDIHDGEAAFINTYRVKIIAKTFGPFKGPGPDGYPPIVYQHFGPAALDRLCRIYKASYLLGCMPCSWREVKVIFLPKPEKPTYAVPKAWRPISLMSFMMKILEKLLLWEFEDTCLSRKSLDHGQHGFRRGRSCDSCLSVVYQEVEHALIKKHYAVAVYLDIEGCYDNIQNERISQAMRKRGASDHYIRWYEDFLYHRCINIKQKGVQVVAYPVQGAPQGGGRVTNSMVPAG